MKKLIFSNAALLGLLALAASSPSQEAESYPAMGTIVRKDARLDKLVPPGARIEKLADGFKWAEGPVWIADGRFLLFSDIPNNRIVEWQEGKGAHTWLQPSGYT